MALMRAISSRWVLAGQKNHRHRARLAQPAEQFHSVHPRHLDVEHAEVRSIVGKGLERRCAVRIDAGDEPFLLKSDRHRSQDIAVVIDERDHLAHARLTICPPTLDLQKLYSRRRLASVQSPHKTPGTGCERSLAL